MASGRVGGTKSKIRGQVGDVIYQVVRNADGSYSQVEYVKGVRVETQTTPRLQAQRMCCSMVEALMRDLKPLATISMQSGANKSKSLNAFSSNNLQLVARDCVTHWYSGNQFYYPTRANIGTTSEEMGGRYILSSGTWQFNGFDSVLHLANPINVWQTATMLGKRFAGVRFHLGSGALSVADFLKSHYMTALDSVCFACFHDWLDYSPDPENPVYHTKHSYIIAKVDSTIPPETIINAEVMRKLFVIDSDWPVFQAFSDDSEDYYIGFLVDNETDNAYIYTYGAFTISYMEGKKKISSSSFMVVDDDADGYFLNQAPADVFGSWMGTPSVKPYPSPFEPTPPPTPTPRLPDDYQEVEWIKKEVSTSWSIPDLWCAYITKIKGKVQVQTTNAVIYFGNAAGAGHMRFGTRSGSGKRPLGVAVYNDSSGIFVKDVYTPNVDDIVEFEWVPMDNGWSMTTNHGDVSNDSFTWPSSVTMLDLPIGGTLSNSRNPKLFEFVGTDIRDNSMMFDLVPCYRKEDGFAGFYDLVSNEFHTCAQSESDFTYGPNVVY